MDIMYHPGVDVVGVGSRLPFRSNAFDEIKLYGVFEHFGYFESLQCLAEFLRCLQSGGLLWLDVPNFDWFVEAYRQLPSGRTLSWVMHAIFGGQDDPGQFHKWGWTESTLPIVLQEAGFVDVTLFSRSTRDPEPNHLGYTARKP